METALRLKDLKPGEVVQVVGYDQADPAYRQKLLAMGITTGVELKLLKIAPLGDPVEVLVRGYHLSLRKAEADILKVRRKD